MKLLYSTEPVIPSTFNEPAIEFTSESYNTQVQPLTELMVEIITFQLKERALFSDFDIQNNSLN